MVPEFKDVTRTATHAHTVKVGDNWGFAALLVPIQVGIALWVMYSFLVGVASAIAAFILVAVILVKAGSTWFEEDKLIPATTVTNNEKVAEHRCCIQCKHPTKALR